MSSSEEISHGKSRGPKKIKHRWTPKENGLPKKVPKKPLEFSKTWPPRSTVTEKWRYVKSRKSTPTISPYEGIVHPKKPCRHAHLRKTPGICLVSVPPVFLLVHFAACLKGNTGHNTELVPCQKEKSPSAKNAFVLLDELAINHGNSSYPKLSPTRK